MNGELYWVWLQKCIGYSKEFKVIIDHFGCPEAVFNASEKSLMELEYLKKRKKLRDKILLHDLSFAEESVNICRKHGIHILPYSCEKYPFALREITNPPMVLYVRGNADCLNEGMHIAVIGSRMPSVYGEKCTRKITDGLVKRFNAIIVSGGALGIDSVSHMSTLESGGKTILVLGCGHGDGYLAENSELRKSVYEHGGALVSEYPPYFSPTRESFPARNRIISGLCKAVVIIEAAEFSGTFSTARHALKQGRELFVLPGDIESGNFAGSNMLISGGATAVFSADDIMMHLDGIKHQGEHLCNKTNNPFYAIDKMSEFSKKAKKNRKKKIESTDIESGSEEVAEKNVESTKKNLPETISNNAKMVYNLMSEGNCTLDELAVACELMPAKLLAVLTELELEGVISKTSDAYRLV